MFPPQTKKNIANKKPLEISKDFFGGKNMFCLSASFKVPHHQSIPLPFVPFELHPNLGIYGDAVALTSGCASQKMV